MNYNEKDTRQNMDLTEEGLIKGATVLIVDDNLTNLRVLIDFLHANGFETLIAQSGEGALEQVQYASPDIVLLDVRMPGMDGFETCIRLKNDSRTKDIPVIFMTALAGEQDKIRGFRCGASDYVTKPFQQEEVLARIRKELVICRQQKELIRLNRTKDKIFSVIAHDLKTPFNGLISVTGLLLESISDMKRENIREFLEIINENSKQTLNLLENLLEWARSQSEILQIYPASCPLQDISILCIQGIETTSSRKSIQIINEIDKNICVFADTNLLMSVFRNLLNNAVKFTRPGGTIRLGAEDKEDRVCIFVSDSGIGIPEERIPTLFRMDELKTTTGTEGEKGTGLGLVICKDFIERMGGSLEVESREGKGSVFRFCLPKIPAPA